MRFLHRVAGCSLRDRMRSSVTREELRVEPLLHREELSEVARASDASWMPPWGGVPGAPHREEIPGKTQDTLEGLCLPIGLRTPRYPPGGAGGSD